MEIKKYSEYIKEDDSQNKMNTIKAIYLISKNGEIVERQVGVASKQQLKGIIEKHLI